MESNDNGIDICIIEDDADQLALMQRQIARHHFSVSTALCGEDGMARIRHDRPKVVICDLMLPDIDGIEICRRVRADPALDGTYFVLVTACTQRELKHSALNTGADDYLTKPYDIVELLARVRNGFRVARLQERLRRAALTDGLTGLWNHAHFRQLCEFEFARLRRYGGVASLLMLDIDHFKALNDTFGHEAGNHVLKATASQLLALVRESDVVARYGGEEFAIVCPNTRIDEAAGLAERIRQSIRRDVPFPNGVRNTVTVSIGVASTDFAGVATARDVIDLADQALYAAKRAGRDRVCRADQAPLPDDGDEAADAEVARLQRQVVSLNWQTRELCLQSVWALVQALEARDRFTAWHSRNTRFYATALAERAGWPESLRTAVGTAAMLHDLGKVGIPDAVLQKPGALTEAEASMLRDVPLMSCKILDRLRIFDTEVLIIRHLRERWDGKGRPDGLEGAKIPIGSRLLAVAEAFDALTSERAYRARHSIDDAVSEIARSASTQFDPQFVELLRLTLQEQRSRWHDQIERTRVEQQVENAATGVI